MNTIKMYEKMATPVGAQYELYGWHYKIGTHGLLYLWTGKQWTRKANFLLSMVVDILTHPVNSKEIEIDEITGEAKAYLDRVSLVSARQYPTQEGE